MTPGIRHNRTFAWLTLLLYFNALVVLPLSTTRWGGRFEAGAMTRGCAEATCCTALCYVDENGTHHCVPAPGRSCDCGMSSGGSASQSEFLERDVVILQPSDASPVFTVSFQISNPPAALPESDLPVPNPPPKSSLFLRLA